METLHVLVVDDNEMKRLLLSETAMLYGMEVTSASTGKEAVEACRCNSYDLVLLDYFLGDCTGDQILAQIELGISDQKRPYFVLASNDPDKCRTFKSMGFDSSFEPPFDPNMLAYIIREMGDGSADRHSAPAFAD